MNLNNEIRWKYRFVNYERAYALLSEALENGAESLSQLEREGVIQRFEFTSELAWNTMKDRLEHGGVALGRVTPRDVIRMAFQSRFIDEAETETWFDMLEDRNSMSHKYSVEEFEEILDNEEVLDNIEVRYLPFFQALVERLGREMLEC